MIETKTRKLTILREEEMTVLDQTMKKMNAIDWHVERKSDRPYDIKIEGEFKFEPDAEEAYLFSAWLPLAAIRELTDWTSREVAQMAGYPEMAEAGDWSGIRDSSVDQIWHIFNVHVLLPKVLAKTN